MPEPIEEETQDNPGEEETPEETEQPQQEPEETPEETPPEESAPQETDQPKYTDREKQYYARMRKAEDKAKKAEEELEIAKKSLPDMSSVDEIVEVQQATAGLSPEEIVELKRRALILDVPLSEARKDVNFTLWQTAWKEKVAKEKQALTPSNKQETVEKPKTLKEKLLAAEKLPFAEQMKEKEKLLAEAGRYKSPKPRSSSPRTYETPA